MRKLRNKVKPSTLLKQQATYQLKVEEYSAMSLNDLKELFNSKKVGGTYKRALLDVVTAKLQEEAAKTGEIVNELPGDAD